MTTAQAATKAGVSARTMRRWAAAQQAGQGNGKLAAVAKNARGHWVITLTSAGTPISTPAPAPEPAEQPRPSLHEYWMQRRRGWAA